MAKIFFGINAEVGKLAVGKSRHYSKHIIFPGRASSSVTQTNVHILIYPYMNGHVF